MQILRLPVAVLVTCSVSTASTASASGELVPARRFPMEVVADRGSIEGLELRLRPDDLAALAVAEAITVTDVRLPGGRTIALELHRARYDARQMRIYRDGEFAGGAELVPAHSSWSGHVEGEAGSDVFVSFARLGSRGWIKTHDRVVHLLAGPEDEAGRCTARFVDESALEADGNIRRRTCGTDREVEGIQFASPAPRSDSPRRVQGGLAAPRQCTMAIETDSQLFQRFADASSMLLYLSQLMEAASDRYVQQVDTYLTVIYLGYYTTSVDPWQEQESGGTPSSLLAEFRAEWPSVRPPEAADATINHFLSGAVLGGGVAAALAGMCNPPFNYAVSTEIADDFNPFPIIQGPLNWDFILFTHETGHLFGSPHTHAFCPPLDTCVSTICSPTVVCMEGTLMSYCSGCPGGMANINPVFHPACVDLMLPHVESCLPIYREGSAYCFGDGLDPLVTVACPCDNFGDPGHGCANSNSALGGAELSSWGGVQPNSIVFTLTGVPNNTLCTFVRGTVNVPAGATFGDGIRCYSGTTLRFGSQLSGQNGNAPNGAQAPAVMQIAGVTRYYQAQYRNPSQAFCPPALFNVSNGWTLAW